MDIEARHRDLDQQIKEEQKRRTPNLDLIAKWKKEKLSVKDAIHHHA